MNIQRYHDEYLDFKRTSHLAVLCLFLALLLIPTCIILIVFNGLFTLSSAIIIFMLIRDTRRFLHIEKAQFFFDSRFGAPLLLHVEEGFPVRSKYQKYFDVKFVIYVFRRYKVDEATFYTSYLKSLIDSDVIPKSALVPGLIRYKEEYELLKQYKAEIDPHYDNTERCGLTAKLMSQRGYVNSAVLDRLEIPYDTIYMGPPCFPTTDDAWPILDEMYGK